MFLLPNGCFKDLCSLQQQAGALTQETNCTTVKGNMQMCHSFHDTMRPWGNTFKSVEIAPSYGCKLNCIFFFLIKADSFSEIPKKRTVEVWVFLSFWPEPIMFEWDWQMKSCRYGTYNSAFLQLILSLAFSTGVLTKGRLSRQEW